MPASESTCRYCGRAITYDRISYQWWDRSQNTLCPLGKTSEHWYARGHKPAED